MMFSRKTISRARGFTLLEILIAVMVFAIVLAAINTIFYSALRLRNNATAAVDAALPVEHALATIKRDLANIVPPNGPLSGSLQSSVTTNNIAGRFGPDFYTASGTIEDTAPWGDIQRVTYLLVESTNRAAGKDLVRAVSRNLLSTTQEAPQQQWLLSNVQTATFTYYDGSQWQADWDSTTTTNLPLAIKMQIQLAPSLDDRSASAALDAPLELLIPLISQVDTNQVTQTTEATP